MVLRPDWCGNCFCNFAIHSDRRVRTDQGADGTPRASVLERVRGVVSLRGEARHVHFHYALRTRRDAKFTAFAISVANLDPTFGLHTLSLPE